MNTPIQLRRGVNIEGWLRDLDLPPAKRALRFGREEAEQVARLGFDHLRINVDEKHLWDDGGAPIADTFSRIDDLLDACQSLGLCAVLDLHVVRSHHFNAPERPLFTEPSCLEPFLECWRKLSVHFRARPVHMLAYEFLNEPVADDPQDWNRVAGAAHKLLRELEPERVLILGSNLWSRPGTFVDLEVPDDDGLILTFHYYRPFLVTHYDVAPTINGGYDGPIHYPGVPIRKDAFEALTPEQREAVAGTNRHYDREVIMEEFRPALELAHRTGLPLYCGEWGCYDTVPRAIRLQWHDDMVANLRDHDIGWAAYAYGGRWGVVRTQSDRMDEELTAILLDEK